MKGKNSIEIPSYTLEIFSDASLSGWGAVCNNQRVNGFWTADDKNHHINYLELKAALLGLQCFANDYKNISILMRIDNTTAISYVNRMGGIKYQRLNAITREIWQWCELRNILIFASYISSKNNVEADFESRKLEPETEYALSDVAFSKIIEFFGMPEVDLFACCSNKKCTRDFSWKGDPGSEAIDAFTVSWEKMYFYAFPPFSIILKMLRKIKRYKAQGIVVVPSWPAQPWYPLFCRMLRNDSIKLKPNKNLLIFCNRQYHPLRRSLSLEAGILSGKL